MLRGDRSIAYAALGLLTGCKPAMLPGTTTKVVVVSTPNASVRTTAKPPSVRRHVDRKILRFSLWVGASRLCSQELFTSRQRFPIYNGRTTVMRVPSRKSIAPVKRATQLQFAKDWQTDQADYVIDTQTRYLIVFPTSTEEDTEHFAPLDYFDTAFIEKFRQPASYNTLDGEVWRLYSQELTSKDVHLDILIGYAMKSSWKIVETPASLLDTVDAALKREADESRQQLCGPRISGFRLKGRTIIRWIRNCGCQNRAHPARRPVAACILAWQCELARSRLPALRSG